MATSVNRRSFFGGMMAHAVGTPILDSVDPVVAAIDQHSNAYAALDGALGRQEELERQWLARSADRDEAELVGDPRWVALQLEVDALDQAEARAATAVIRTAPSTAVGMAALTLHVVTFRDRVAGGRLCDAEGRHAVVSAYFCPKSGRVSFVGLIPLIGLRIGLFSGDYTRRHQYCDGVGNRFAVAGQHVFASLEGRAIGQDDGVFRTDTKTARGDHARSFQGLRATSPLYLRF
jgi:hypothetical protein